MFCSRQGLTGLRVNGVTICSPSMHKVLCLIYLLDPLQCWPRCEDSRSQHLGLASLALKAQLSQY